MTRNSELLPLLCVMVTCGEVLAFDGPFHVREDGMIADRFNRSRIFHGFNDVIKRPPWYDPHLLNQTRLERYKYWGFNAVRIGAMWSGVHLGPGRFNETYLSVLKQTITGLSDHGIYTLLDMHQDVLTSACQSYDGAPRWVIDLIPKPEHPYPWPLKKVSAWAEGYITQCTGHYFQGIYDNVGGARQMLLEFWKKIAETLKDVPGLLGYELINEPWAGNIFAHPTYLLPGVAGRKNLQPLYDLINDAIRSVDNQTLIFFEPVTWGYLFKGHSDVGMGLIHAPGGDKWKHKSVISYHYYCWLINENNLKKPFPPVERYACDDLLEPNMFRSVASDAQLLGTGSFLTEFGICGKNNITNSTGTLECDSVMNMADDFLQSWSYWDSTFFDANGHEQTVLVSSFTRPYVRYTNGDLVSQRFKVQDRTFTTSFYPKVNVTTAVAEIFVPPVHYHSGVHLSVSHDQVKYFYDKENSVVNVFSSLMQRELVTVNMSPTN